MVIRDIPHTTWVSVNNLSGYPIGSRLKLINQGQAPLVLKVSSTKPLDSDLSGKLLKEVEDELSRTMLNADNEELWVRSLSSVSDGILYTDANLLFQDGVEGIDPRIQSGTAAFTMQSYDESNKKAGVQYEASRLVTLGNVATIYSVIKTGQYPVDLKKREFAYSGLGVEANIYLSPQYTGGVSDPIYNMRPSQGSPETQLLSAITLVNSNKGAKCGATIYAIGNTSNQGKGNSGAAYATNRILEPNTEYLLEVISLSAQDVAARIEFYEGILDRDGSGL